MYGQSEFIDERHECTKYPLEDNTLDEVSGDDRNVFTFLVVQIVVRSIGPLTVLADPLLPALQSKETG